MVQPWGSFVERNGAIWRLLEHEPALDKGNDGHGSKVIAVPFDGAALDRDLQSLPDPSKP
jgi:hypothetical protein